MEKRIAKLEGHVIVAGAGATGVHVLEELHAAGAAFVVVDRDADLLGRVSAELGGDVLHVAGDATEDAVLEEAGVRRAAGVVAALADDRDNLYVTLSARTMNATARIVARVVAPEAAGKMIRAGANATVSPNMIGGRRLASEIVRPTVVEFLDQMMRDRERGLRFEEVRIPAGAWVVGKRLREVPIRQQTDLLVVALREGDAYLYNPGPDAKLRAESVLVVLGESRNVAKLRALVADPRR